MAVAYQCPRGTRAALNTLAGSNGLRVGQVYLITDENRLAVGLTTSTYEVFEKRTESTFLFVLDGGGVTLPAGSYTDLPEIPYNCSIIGWTLVSDVSANAQLTIRRATYANYPTMTIISGSDTQEPRLAAAQKNSSSTMTGWTTALTKGDILRATLDSDSDAKKLQLGLRVLAT